MTSNPRSSGNWISEHFADNLCYGTSSPTNDQITSGDIIKMQKILSKEG